MPHPRSIQKLLAALRSSRTMAAPILLLLTIIGLSLGAVAARPGLVADAADPAADRALGSFYAAEQSATDRFRWSAPRSNLYLYGFQGEAALLRLRLAAPRPANASPAALSLMIGERSFASIGVASGWRRYEVLLPSDPVSETVVTFGVAPYAAPGDSRELGIMLGAIASFPVRASGGPVLPVRGMFLASLPMLCWLFLKRLRAADSLALLVGGLVIFGVGWAAASPSESGYWLPTLGWPWWPLLPLAVLLLWPQIEQLRSVLRTWARPYPAIGWAGLGLAFAGLLGIRFGGSAALGLVALVAGAWLAAVVLADLPGLDTAFTARLSVRFVASSLVTITAIALFLRLVNLDGQPAGLWRDESRHALQALAIWEDASYRPVYVVEGADLPALLFYLMAPVVGLFGPHAWSARLVSVLAGAFTPLALYWAAGPIVGRRAALCGAALLAAASWSLSMSRWAFPATLDHLLVLAAVGCLWRGLVLLVDDPALAAEQHTSRHGSLPMRSVGWGLLGLAGALGGLATYAYHTGRMAPIALVVVSAIFLGRRVSAWRQAWPGLLIAAAAGLLVMAPLLIYIGSDLEGYNRRVGTVTVFDSVEPLVRKPLEQVLQNIERYILMWHVRGEANGRHHMPGAPMLDPFTGLLLMIGLTLAIPRAMHSRRLLALLGLWAVYFIPGIFSGGAPHAMRSLGTLAPACALAGLGLAAIAERWRKARPLVYMSPLICVLLFNAWLYFGVMAYEPRVYRQFDLAESATGRITQQAAAYGVAVYLPASLARTDTVSFLTHGAPAQILTNDPIPPGPAMVLLPAKATAEQQAAALTALGPQAVILDDLPTYPGTTQPLLLGYGRGADAALVLRALSR